MSFRFAVIPCDRYNTLIRTMPNVTRRDSFMCTIILYVIKCRLRKKIDPFIVTQSWYVLCATYCSAYEKKKEKIIILFSNYLVNVIRSLFYRYHSFSVILPFLIRHKTKSNYGPTAAVKTSIVFSIQTKFSSSSYYGKRENGIDFWLELYAYHYCIIILLYRYDR